MFFPHCENPDGASYWDFFAVTLHVSEVYVFIYFYCSKASFEKLHYSHAI